MATYGVHLAYRRGCMAPRSHQVPLLLLLLLLLSAAATVAASSGYYSFPVFDGKSTADGIVVATNSSMLSPATFLFDAQLFPKFNESDGFVLLSRPVALWRVGTDDGAREEASFSTIFTVDVQGSSSDALSFVVLLESFPPLNSKNEKHGPRHGSLVSAVPNATNGIAAVKAGTVSSYGHRSPPGIGLNVTITPNRSSAGAVSELAVRIDYDAAVHRLLVYVDDGVNNKTALLDAPLDLAGRQPTQTAMVGFFSAMVRDVVVGVRGWELTVDGLQDDVDDGPRRQRDEQSTSSSSWLVILLAVPGSVAGAAAVVVSVMVYLVVSRRRAVDMEVQQCYRDYFARTAQGNGERTVE